LTKFKRALDNLKKAKSELEEVYKAIVHRTKRLCKDDAEGDVAKGVDKHVDCTSKTRTLIGRFPIGDENQILIGQIREWNVVRKKAAVCGEERCVTSLKTAAKETNINNVPRWTNNIPAINSSAFKTKRKGNRQNH